MSFALRRPYVVVLLALCGANVAAQQRADPPYVVRGRQVEGTQRVLTERVSTFHRTLAAAVGVAAPEWLPRLEPPRPIATGYQLLPRILPAGEPQTTLQAPQIISYGWRWSETLMGQETAAVKELEDRLARRTSADRALLDSIIVGYRALVDRKRLVDSDVNYNWLWQAEITRVPGVFQHAQRLQNTIIEHHQLAQTVAKASAAAAGVTVRTSFDSLLADRAAFVERGLAADVRRIDMPDFVRVERVRQNEWRIAVPVYTDITDTAFVVAFTRAVEDHWRIHTDSANYRVELEVRFIPPATLYCAAALAGAACAPPAVGSPIDVGAHIARFPQGGAVVTTGAGSTHVTSIRAIMISPHDAPTTVFAHEFGHILGLRDAYLRGFVEAGADGFIITELVVDHTDIMGNSGRGRASAAHFERLIAVKDVPALMKDGMKEAYERRDQVAAISRFRSVLERSPYNYGATIELARALDRTMRTEEARVQWRKVLEAAERIGDVAIAQEARTRVAG